MPTSKYRASCGPAFNQAIHAAFEATTNGKIYFDATTKWVNVLLIEMVAMASH